MFLCRWQRETRMRTVAGRLQGEVTYFAPCGKKLRQYPDVVKYLVRHGITDISRDNFSFSTKIKVGNFYEGREGPEVRVLFASKLHLFYELQIHLRPKLFTGRFRF
ncbi:Bromodomain adjacent to zinc finger domain protein 2B [Ilyodon furcidens]|uniref:Bromodomain adjacent to zinc finger domain protein 2B n=1 Tax=Ilyodon furcidens TaxID=33524 RepID=A0ABV0TDF8_9TELE